MSGPVTRAVVAALTAPPAPVVAALTAPPAPVVAALTAPPAPVVAALTAPPAPVVAVVSVGDGVADGLPPVSVGVGVGAADEVSDGLGVGAGELALAVGVGPAVLALGDGVAVQATTGALKTAFLWDVPVTGWLGLTPSGACQSPGEEIVSGSVPEFPPFGEVTELVGESTVGTPLVRAK
jgi:hypothetical protein